MAHALMAGAALAGMDFRIIGPAQFFPEDDFTAKCKEIAKKTGATFTFTDDPVEGVKGLDVIYTGVWVTMGDPMSFGATASSSLCHTASLWT